MSLSRVLYRNLIRECHSTPFRVWVSWQQSPWVTPEARRHDVGAHLLTAALRHARSEFHVRQVNLGVNARNVAAIALYKRLGFVEFGLERDYLMDAGVFHDERHMVWFAPEIAASTTE